MEYYIFKLYQKKKGENPEVEPGFNRFEPKIKKYIIACFVVMIAAILEMILTTFFIPDVFWYLIGFFIAIITFFILYWIDSKNQTKYMDKYVDSHVEKIEILFTLLSNEFKINSREKVEELISLYQMYIDKKDQEEKKRNTVNMSIVSAFAGMLSITFVNMNNIGINLGDWLYLAIILLIILGFTLCFYGEICFLKNFDSLKAKYKIMIKDLKDLQLMKY